MENDLCGEIAAWQVTAAIACLTFALGCGGGAVEGRAPVVASVTTSSIDAAQQSLAAGESSQADKKYGQAGQEFKKAVEHSDRALQSSLTAADRALAQSLHDRAQIRRAQVLITLAGDRSREAEAISFVAEAQSALASVSEKQTDEYRATAVALERLSSQAASPGPSAIEPTTALPPLPTAPAVQPASASVAQEPLETQTVALAVPPQQEKRPAAPRKKAEQKPAEGTLASDVRPHSEPKPQSQLGSKPEAKPEPPKPPKPPESHAPAASAAPTAIPDAERSRGGDCSNAPAGAPVLRLKDDVSGTGGSFSGKLTPKQSASHAVFVCSKGDLEVVVPKGFTVRGDELNFSGMKNYPGGGFGLRWAMRVTSSRLVSFKVVRDDEKEAEDYQARYYLYPR